MIARRKFLRTGGLLLAGLAAPAIWTRGEARTKTDVFLNSNPQGSQVWFDPVGLWVEPGSTIRWINAANVHTVTAYHPANANHSLRIPEMAAPFDSGYLVNPGDEYEISLPVAGTYDYFCAPHEQGGMVGRIIVGAPGGPGSRRFNYFKDLDPVPGWQPVPMAARPNFPSEDRIMSERIIRQAA